VRASSKGTLDNHTNEKKPYPVHLLSQHSTRSPPLQHKPAWFPLASSCAPGLPHGRVVLLSIADSAIAKSRPLPERAYEALRLLGAPDPTEVREGARPTIRSVKKRSSTSRVEKHHVAHEVG